MLSAFKSSANLCLEYDFEIPSELQIPVGLCSHALHLLFDLVGDLNFRSLVLPVSEFVLMELLLELGLHICDFLVVGPSLVDELL